MSRLLLVFSLALVASTRFAVAGEVDLVACQWVAREVLLGLSSPHQNLELCNASDQCENFEQFIEQHGKAVPSLTCAKAARSAPASPKEFTVLFENACAMVATRILVGNVPGDPEGQIALCNKTPGKKDCVDTKNFIESERPGAAGALTCE